MLLLADVPAWVASLREYAMALAAIAGALVTIGAAAKLPIISRPIHWLWRRVVAEPVAAWVDGLLHHHTQPILERVEAVEHEVRTNNGSSLRDVADRSESGMRQIAGHLGIELDLPEQHPPQPR